MEKRICGQAYCMMNLILEKKSAEPLTVLCLGAHSDDIEIGCGGTLLQLRENCNELKFHWVVFSAVAERGEEALKGAHAFTAGSERDIVLLEFRDGFLPYIASQVKEAFEKLKGGINPDIIFTHWQGDAHQDHRLISELTWNTFRNHFILEYEIPKFDGDMGRPNTFVPLGEPAYREKADNLCEVFASQRSKRWFARETFLGLMRLRGVESNSPSGYAEAFYARKVLIDVAAGR
jgi:LmbE family N-acetylglucosaminyl deacetylase